MSCVFCVPVADLGARRDAARHQEGSPLAAAGADLLALEGAFLHPHSRLPSLLQALLGARQDLRHGPVHLQGQSLI